MTDKRSRCAEVMAGWVGVQGGGVGRRRQGGVRSKGHGTVKSEGVRGKGWG